MKRVQVEPHLSVTGACSAEWVPIKPKTDAAFLFAMIHVLLHEHPRERLDLPFLKQHTVLAVSGRAERLLPARPRNAQAAGRSTPSTGRAVPFDTRRHRSERWKAASTSMAIEIGADEDDHLARRRVTGEPAFAHLVAHVTPLFAGMGGGDLRRAGGHHPPDRERVPRPCARRRDDRDRGRDAAVAAGRDLARQDRQQRLGRLRMLLGAHAARRLVGALEVPGGTLGTTVRLNRPADNRWSSVTAGAGRLHGAIR